LNCEKKEIGKMKKLFLFFLTAVLSAVGLATSPAAVRADLTQPVQGINITESSRFAEYPTAMMGTRETGNDPSYFLCSSISDETCTASVSIFAWNHLPPCISSILTNCIASVFAVDAEGVKTEGKFVKYATPDSTYDYPERVENNLPQGKSQGGIWELPGITHSGGNDFYYASTFVNATLQKSAGSQVSSEKFGFSTIESGIQPVNEITGNFGPSFPLDNSNPSNDGSKNGGLGAGVNPGGGPNSCLLTSTGICYMAQDFPKELRFGMKVILGSNLQGWFHGRIFQPTIDIQPNGSGQTLTFEAIPVQVPTLKKLVSTTEVTGKFREFLSGNRVFSQGGQYFQPGNSGTEAIEMAGYWLPLVNDKATTSNTYWNVRTLEGNQDPDVARCSTDSDKLAGVVTTNSLVYSAGPPTYNKNEGSLDYKLLSPHFTATGEEAIGTYDLVLRSDVARCIYGFSRAPIQAIVSIVSAEGENKVATTLIREKDGWLTLSANGFTFSSPTIRVKLSQNATETEILAPVVPTKVSLKKTTITCSKGKEVKRIYGVKPKCPTGYKKR
jgi:hypothetical protein